MKRSEINRAIEWAKKLFKKQNIALPPFAYWEYDEWVRNEDRLDIITKVMLGWDVTDYGLDDYGKIGGVLFTVRNGIQEELGTGVPYAEKYILLKDGQGLPTHFHYTKTEDIINRAGGTLALKLNNANRDESIDTISDVVVYIDSIKHTFKAGQIVIVPVGSSITLTPFMYHSFWALEGKGNLILGEVSSINDDNFDNRFNPTLPRFGIVFEDERIIHPLCNEYSRLFKK